MKNQLATQEQINLPIPQKEFVQLRMGHRAVSELSKPALKSACAEILTTASFEMGSPMADDETILDFQTQALVNELKGKLATLTLPEVREAFKRGIRGESGVYFGMCPKTYHQFLKWFFELPERGKSWLAYLDQVSHAPAPTIDKTLFSKMGIQKAFESYKQYQKLPVGAFAYYDLLNEEKGVDYNGVKTLITDPKIRKDAVDRSKKEYQDSMLKAKKTATSKGAFNQAEAIVASLAAEGKEDNALPNIIKREFLREYFKMLIEKGEDL